MQTKSDFLHQMNKKNSVFEQKFLTILSCFWLISHKYQKYTKQVALQKKNMQTNLTEALFENHLCSLNSISPTLLNYINKDHLTFHTMDCLIDESDHIELKTLN